MAVKRLLWRRVASVTITNINIIRRPDNLAMIRLLGVKLIYVEEIEVNNFDRFVIVDSQPDHHECFSMLQSKDRDVTYFILFVKNDFPELIMFYCC